MPIKVANNDTPFTSFYKQNEIINLPIAHGEGNYVADEATLKKMKENGQIIFTYVDNPNGSMENIAGICNEDKMSWIDASSREGSRGNWEIRREKVV